MVKIDKKSAFVKSAAKKRLILNISRMTVHNGPGIRTLIQFKGCPLRCTWCSTPESQADSPELAVVPAKCIHCDQCLLACPRNAIRLSETDLRIDRSKCDVCGKCTTVCYPGALSIIGQMMTVEALVTEAEKDEVVYKHSGGGVTLSGGEPLVGMDFTLELLKALAEAHLNVGVDTCGYIPPNDLEKTIPYVDFFLWDIKVMDDRQHKEFTGVSNKLILENLKLVSRMAVPVYIRIPLIPGYSDYSENIKATCEFVRDLKSLVEIDLLPLHHLGRARYASLDRPYPIEGIPLIPDDHLVNIKNLVESYRLSCKIIG